jgi:hypothetical protein
VDWNIGSNDTLFGRFRTDHGVQATNTDPINPAFNAFSTQPEFEGQLNWTHILGSTATNQFVFSNIWYQAVFGPQNLTNALNTFPTTLTFGNGLMSNLGGQDYLYPQGRNTEQYQFIDDFSKLHGNHNFKFGVNFKRDDVSDYSYGPYTSGLMSINSMSDFVNGMLSPNSGSYYNQSFSNIRQVPIALYSLGAYFQDQWNATSKLSITAGLRIDRNSNPTCRTNCFARPAGSFTDLAADPNGTTPYNQQILTGQSNAFPNIQPIVWEPRLGIAYQLTPKTMVRGGVGFFSDLYPALLIDNFVTNAPNELNLLTTSGLVANGVPGSSAYNLAASAAAFNAGFGNGASYSTLSSLPGFTAPNINTSANKIYNPEYVEYNLQIEHQINNNVVASVNYVGNHGYHELMNTPWYNAYSPSSVAGLPTAPTNGGFGIVNELNNVGSSNYNGITFSTKWHKGSFFQGSVNYTYSHALDDCSNNCLSAEPFSYMYTTVANQLTPGLASTLGYGPADYDVRHSFNANYVLIAPDKPFHNTWMDRALGGWTFANTFYVHSGLPYSVINNSLGATLNVGGASVLGQYLGGAIGSCSSPNTPCLTPSQFVPAGAQTTFGSPNRNAFRGPGYFDTDINLTKNVRLNERFTLGIGANAYNVLNHPNFAVPTNYLSSGNFGQIMNTVGEATSPYGSFATSQLSGRIIQLHAKLTF